MPNRSEVRDVLPNPNVEHKSLYFSICRWVLDIERINVANYFSALGLMTGKLKHEARREGAVQAPIGGVQDFDSHRDIGCWYCEEKR